jgi:hypothetical protein
VLLYDLTLSMRGYTPQSNAWSAEAHYTIALPGSIHQNREWLREFAIPHFQGVMRRHYGMYIRSGEIRGSFQREQPALSRSRTLHVDVLETVYRGRQHYDRYVASEDLPYYSSDEIGKEMTPQEEAEIERRLLRGHVPGYDLPRRKDEGNDEGEDEPEDDEDDEQSEDEESIDEDEYDDSDEDNLDEESEEDEDELDEIHE